MKQGVNIFGIKMPDQSRPLFEVGGHNIEQMPVTGHFFLQPGNLNTTLFLKRLQALVIPVKNIRARGNDFFRLLELCEQERPHQFAG